MPCGTSGGPLSHRLQGEAMQRGEVQIGQFVGLCVSPPRRSGTGVHSSTHLKGEMRRTPDRVPPSLVS